MCIRAFAVSVSSQLNRASPCYPRAVLCCAAEAGLGTAPRTGEAPWRPSPVLLTMLALLVVALCPSYAFAQAEGGDAEAGGAAPENAEATRQAREHFEAGMAHFDGRRFREAIREFELASQLVPSADLWFNIARAHEELSEYDPAIEQYRRYLRDRVDPPDRERVESRIHALEERAEAARAARRTAPTTGTLRVRASVDGASVSLDGNEIGRSPIEMPLSLSPGGHRLAVHQGGYVPFESEVQIQPGVTTAAYADLEPAIEFQADRATPIFAWIVGGLSVVSLGASTFFGIRAAGRASDGDYPGAQDTALTSDRLLGAGIGLAVTALVLYFIESRSVGTERVEGPAQH